MHLRHCFAPNLLDECFYCLFKSHLSHISDITNHDLKGNYDNFYLINAFISLAALALGMFGAFGITAGAHRLWSHRSYKAKWPLRLILMLSQTLAFQNSIYEWVRDHRVHHKFTDTDADPHNARRGFFFSHIGWLMVKKHPDVKARGKAVDMSDLETDGIVMFQKK